MMLSTAITTVFICGASFASRDSCHASNLVKDDPPIRTEVMNEQKVKLSDLKGPRAKNHPAYKYGASQVVVKAPHTSAERQVGPDAKNDKPWKNDTRTQHIVVTQKERKNLKGPRAKNQKPGDQ